MAIDWGNVLGSAVGAMFDPFDTLTPYRTGVSQLTQSIQDVPNMGNGGTPRTVTVDTVTGKVSACKRRRRRKMLTEGDFNTLLRVANLPNNQNVRIALAKAIGRR